VLFFGLFCYFTVFFPLVPLEIFLPTLLQRSDLFLPSSQSATCYYMFNYTNVEVSIKCLAQEHKKETYWLVLYTIPLIPNDKQENCDTNFLSLSV